MARKKRIVRTSTEAKRSTVLGWEALTSRVEGVPGRRERLTGGRQEPRKQWWKPEGLIELRRLAEEAIKEPTRRPRLTVQEDMQVLIHELQTHQVELEMQNDELRRAEQELQAGHEELEAEHSRYELLFELAPQPDLVTDLRGRIQEANAAACRMLGPTRPKLLGAALPLFFAEKDFEAVRGLLAAAREGRSAGTERLQTCIQQGEQAVACEVSTNEVKNTEGQVVGLRWLLYEITQRKPPLIRAPSGGGELLASARDVNDPKPAETTVAELAALLDLAHDAIILRGAGDRIRFWSRGAQETYGWTREEALGHVTHELLKTRFPKSLAELSSEVVDKGSWEGELTHTRKDGAEIVVDSRWAAQRDGEGRQVGVMEINRDITERKRAEEALQRNEAKYRSLFDAIDEGFCIFEVIFDVGAKAIDLQYLEVNPSFERQTGWVNASGRTVRELVPGYEDTGLRFMGASR